MNKSFLILTLARWFSEIGDWLNYMVQLTIIKDYEYISIMIAIINITPFVISPLVGNYVESHNNINTILISQTALILASVFLYTAYLIPEYWYLIYIYVFIQAICVCFKITSYQNIIPTIVETEQIEKANKIQVLSQASVYVISIGGGGIMLNYLNGISNLITDNTVYVVSIILILYLKYLIQHTITTNDELQHNEQSKREPISFKNGLVYLKKNPEFIVIILINSLIYYIYGCIEIINYKLGFDSYDVLTLSIVIGLSTTGTIILYFYKSNRYILNYIILLISILFYGIIEIKQLIPLWFIGFWLFNYIHYAYYIMMTIMVQKDADSYYKGRLYTYYYGTSAVSYALGSFSGSLFYPWYWIPIVVSIIIIGIMIVKFYYIQKNNKNTDDVVFKQLNVVNTDIAIDIINNTNDTDELLEK